MRRKFFVWVMVLHVWIASSIGGDVEISVVQSWADKQKLRSVCGTKVRGCTRFTGTRLVAVCASDSAEWAMRASAVVVALMVLPKPGVIYEAKVRNHEDLHVADVEADVDSHVQRIHSQRYSTQQACEDAARGEGEAFRDRVAEFARASSLKRD